jgi:type IVB pilus formation R64 PilN family outer membrane protein
MKPVSLAALIGTMLLPACSSMQNGIADRVDAGEARGSALVRDVGKLDGKAGKALQTVQYDAGIWIGRSLARTSQVPLPPIFNQPTTFERSVSSLAEFAERITLRSGIPTKITSDASNAGQPEKAQASAKIPQLGMPAAAEKTSIRIDFSGGNLKGLLDTAAARFGVSWKYANGNIQFFHTDTRTFQIAAVPGDSALTASVSSGASSGGGGGGGASAGAGGSVNATNAQNTAVKSTLSVFSSIEKAIGIMLSGQGKVVASPATGSITVSDTPDNLERIALFVDKENLALSRQVMVNVTVLAVTLTRGDNYGIKWDAVYKTLTNKYGLSNSLATAANSSAFSASILNTATSKLAGTTMMIEALSEQGRVRRETSASVVTLNNQPVPVQVAKQTSYLQSSQTTQTPNVGSTTTLTPGTITTGFNMSILPNVLNNGIVMLQFSTDISSLRALRTVSSNNASIETPETETRNFLQRVAMKSNETLIISGFEQTDDNLNQQGIGTPANLLLGGSVGATTNKEVIVIMITPIAMRAS